MNKESKIYLAVLSGIFATAGGVFAKLSGFYEIANIWSTTLKLLLLGAMVTSNTIGCTLFVKALAESGSSLPSTVASSSVNYICSALVGLLLFGETTSLRWWLGTSLVVLGLLLICNSPTSSERYSSCRKMEKEEKLEKEKEQEEEEEEAEEEKAELILRRTRQ